MIPVETAIHNIKGSIATAIDPFQSVKKVVFDRLTEVKEAPKTSNSHASAYVDTVAGELRSKSKHLAQQAFFHPAVNCLKSVMDSSFCTKSLFSLYF